MPALKEYRVTGLAATYNEPRSVVVDGEVKEHLIATHAIRGQVIGLTESEAERLCALGTVKGVDEPLGYDELSTDQLKSLAHERGVSVVGSGVNGEATEGDIINALRNADQGATLASSSPGGTVRTAAGSSQGVYVDPPVSTEEPAKAPKPRRGSND